MELKDKFVRESIALQQTNCVTGRGIIKQPIKHHACMLSSFLHGPVQESDYWHIYIYIS